MTKMKVKCLGALRTECVHESGARIETDAPKDNKGKGEAFSPTDLFAASLASCMLTIMEIAAQRCGISLQGTTVELEKEMVVAPVRRIGKIIVRFRSAVLPNSEERAKLEKAALECPVHHSLHPDIKIETDFIWGL